MTTKVLVLCQGNRFRSPVCAAVLARSPGLEVRSAGFKEGGHSADKKMREYAQGVGLDLSNHESQQISPELVRWADRIVYMSPANFAKLSKFASEDELKRKAICLGEYANPPADRIRDPGGLSGNEFKTVMDSVVASSKRLAAKLSKAATPAVPAKGRWGSRPSEKAGSRDFARAA